MGGGVGHVVNVLYKLFFFLFSFTRRAFRGRACVSSHKSALLCHLLHPRIVGPSRGCPLILFLRNTKRHNGSGRGRLIRNKRV